MAESIYDRLRDGIVDGMYGPGTAMREAMLAEHFGTSRTPIREALRRLEQDGLVVRGGRGLEVRAPSADEILEIYEVRIVLEVAAARAAAERRTELDLIRLNQVHEAMVKMKTDDPHELAEINRDFHQRIWRASHNNTLVSMLERVNAHLVQYRGTTLAHGDRWQRVLAEHDALLAALSDRDVAKAGAIAEEHMTDARNHRLLMYAETAEN